MDPFKICQSVDTIITSLEKKDENFSKYFTEAIEKTDYDEAVKDEVWGFIYTSIKKLLIDVKYVNVTCSFPIFFTLKKNLLAW